MKKNEFNLFGLSPEDIMKNLENAFNDVQTAAENTMRYYIPRSNIRNEETVFVLEIDLPGVNKEDIVVTIEEEILTIAGKREFNTPELGELYTKRETPFGEFKRSFNLAGNEVKHEKIKSTFVNGVLIITIPKKKQKEPSNFNVKVD